MKKIHDLTGQRFGSLEVIQLSDRRLSANMQWLCRCDCGRKVIVRGDNLVTGHSTQCSVCKTRGGRISVFAEGGDDHGVV